MNPYDFVALDFQHLPDRRIPVWHHTLAPPGKKVYSGYLSFDIFAETPIFIRDADSPVNDRSKAGEHIHNKQGDYIIPGSSLKGLLRTVVETISGGCLTGFRVLPKEYKDSPVPEPQPFLPCHSNTALCISCRIFGMMQKSNNFLGKITISDALHYEDSLSFYKSMYTPILSTPKPNRRSFYLTPEGTIAGRKFYFHHNNEPQTRNNLSTQNQHIKPLDRGTEFFARLDFSNLEADEFAALLLALSLQESMRHKIGYGKPIGLGTIQLTITELCLIDYQIRYTNLHSEDRGTSWYDLTATRQLLDEQGQSLSAQVATHWSNYMKRKSFQQLAKIWSWNPEDRTFYQYPSQTWFWENPHARIEETYDLSWEE
jgi:CRISPR/Cas system CSM-associated protein Csm3 (group 7 of RAMP superfamily)